MEAELEERLRPPSAWWQHGIVTRLLDVVLLITAIALASVWLRGGGTFVVHGLRVSMTKPGPPALAFGAAIILRVAAGFFGLPEGPGLSLGALARIESLLRNLGRARAAQALAILSLASIGLKLFDVVHGEGFYSGDDNEIHNMTFPWLFGLKFSPWGLRSVFYPAVFIYPAQALAHFFFPDSADAAIIAGRCVGVASSTLSLWLIYRIARKELGTPGYDLLAAVLLAFNQLNVVFGSMELPRIVSANFVLLAYLVLRSTSTAWRSAILGGLFLAVAQCIRFSEGIFLAPAILELGLQRKYRLALLVGTSFVVFMAAIQGVADAFYWGQPFHSLIEVVKFTLVQGASTRGLQPFYDYLNTLPDWSNAAVLVLALGAIRIGRPALVLWTWLPAIMLSCLPHKEPRYFIPVIPFVVLSAATSLRDLLTLVRAHVTRWQTRAFAKWTAAALLFGFLGCSAFEASHLVYERWWFWIPVARYLERIPDPGGVAFEDFCSWNAARLYIRRAAPFVSLDWQSLRDKTATSHTLRDPVLHWVAIRQNTLDENPGYPQYLAGEGFTEVPLARESPYQYHLYRR